MITLYIDFAVVNGRDGDVVNWVTGWLYNSGYAFDAEKYKWDGEWKVRIYTKGLEPVDDIVQLIIDGFGDDLRYFVNEVGAEVDAVSVCNREETECTDIQLWDLEELEKQEHLEREERWNKMITAMIYGKDDDPEYAKYKEAIRWERMMGIRNDGDMLDVALEQEDYE